MEKDILLWNDNMATPKEEKPLNPTFDFRFINVASLIIKVTNRCNLNCAYCYENISKTGQDMSIHIFKNIVDKVMVSSESKTIQFIFHGGEPTLIKDNWYLEAVSYARTMSLCNNKVVSFGLQTNLTALTEDKIELFKYLNIAPGVSIDDPTLTMGSLRQKNETKVVKNFLWLRETGVKFGLLFTINSNNYNNFPKILTWLENNNIKSFKANVIYPVGHGQNSSSLTANMIFQAHKDILLYLIETKGKSVIEHNLVWSIQDFFGQERKESLCHDKTCGAGSKVIGITSEGNILPCGRFQWNDENYFLGNISEIKKMEYSVKLNSFHAKAENNWINCRVCQAKKICSYGCQAFIVRSSEQINIECSPTKMLYEFMENHSNDLRTVYNNLIEIKAFSNNSSYTDYKDKYSDYSDYYDKASGGDWDREI